MIQCDSTLGGHQCKLESGHQGIHEGKYFGASTDEFGCSCEYMARMALSWRCPIHGETIQSREAWMKPGWQLTGPSNK